LMHIYYKVHGMSFPGERGALSRLREHEPEIASRIEAFFAAAGGIRKFRRCSTLSIRITSTT